MTTLRISQSVPFDPVAFIGEGWSRMEEEGKLPVPPKINLSNISFVTMLDEDESEIPGQETLRRLKAAGHVRLDANVFQSIWEIRHLLPKIGMRSPIGRPNFVFFDGTTFRSPRGCDHVLCLGLGEREWNWFCLPLDRARRSNYLSAVLKH